MPPSNHLLEALRKHLPPSTAELKLLDINGETGAYLQAIRADVLPLSVGGQVATWMHPAESVDAVTAVDYMLNADFLAAALAVLRPGGRLIVANALGRAPGQIGAQLEAAGYVRILVEELTDGGVLIRGEKRHNTADTLQRIQQVAGDDADRLDLATYRGRYVHLLIQQMPNKPVWRLQPDEPITWSALAVRIDNTPTLLAFSSLPKAVGFMQPAVLAGKIKDINKVGKFSKATAQTWTHPVLLNPAVSVLDHADSMLIAIDPDTAEAPDE